MLQMAMGPWREVQVRLNLAFISFLPFCGAKIMQFLLLFHFTVITNSRYDFTLFSSISTVTQDLNHLDSQGYSQWRYSRWKLEDNRNWFIHGVDNITASWSPSRRAWRRTVSASCCFLPFTSGTRCRRYRNLHCRWV